MMALTREWWPTGNKSGGGTKRLLVLHSTEGWYNNPDGMYDCAHYFQGPVGASSNVVIDDYHPGRIVEMVVRTAGAWTQCNYNSVSISVEMCATAAWSRSTWLQKTTMLDNVSRWLREESDITGIPLAKLTSSQAQGSGRGVCYHSDLGSAGCGHSDPGAGFPIDVVLDMALGGGQPPVTTPPAEEETLVFPGVPGIWLKYREFQAPSGKMVGFGVGTNGRVYYTWKDHGADTIWKGPTVIQ
jgi:hypothetical protein